MVASPASAKAVIEATASIVARVMAAAAAGDGAAAAAAVQPLLRKPCSPQAVVRIVGAALDLDHAAFLEVAAALAIAADLSVVQRIHVAWRFAIVDKAEAAMAILLCDPRIFAETARLKQIIVTLQKVQARPGPQALVHHQARMLVNRFLPPAPAPAGRADRSFAGDRKTRPQALGAPVTLHAAPMLPPVIRTEVENVLATFERQTQRAPFPEIHVYPDVFVNRRGQIWGRDGTVYRSFSMPVPAESRQAEATAPELPTAALAIETHNNVYHWLAECYPSLAWCLDEETGEIPILVRDDAARFVRESLALGAAGALPLVEAGDAVLVRQLLVADRGLALLARQGSVGALLSRLRTRSVAQASGASGPAAGADVYISRRDSRKRTLANEDALEEALIQRGFEIAVMSQLPFAEQVARVSNARTIVAPHGAGLALLAAAQPGRRVMEVVPAMRGGMELRTCMAKISRLVGHDHHLWLQPEPPNGAGWTLSLEPFLAALDALPPAAAVAPHNAGR